LLCLLMVVVVVVGLVGLRLEVGQDERKLGKAFGGKRKY